MLAVILGHMSVGKWNILIFSFHMPLFFIISGFFLHLQDNNSYANKRAIQLLVPYVFTCGCIITLALFRSVIRLVFLGNEYVITITGTIIRWSVAAILGSGKRTDYFGIEFDYYIGAIWFLLAMFWATLLLNVLLKYHYGKVCIILISCLGIASARWIWLPWSIQPGAVAAVFVLIGYQFKNKLNDLLNNKRFLLSCFGCWCLYLLLCFWTNTRISVASVRYPWLAFDFIAPTAASMCILWFSMKICSLTSHIKLFLLWFGKNSLIILCFHLIELTQFPWNRVQNFIQSYYDSKIVILLLVYVSKILWACLSVILVHKVKFLCKVFSIRSEQYK